MLTPLDKKENVALLSVFNTEFFKKILQTILSEVQNLWFVQHVGSLESWPLELRRGDYAALIFNTHYANQPGEHWFAVFIDGSTQTAYTFDSLPLRPFPHVILLKLKSICNSMKDINPHGYILQNPEYPLCGLYCLTFLERFSKKQPLPLCPNNPTLNDITVLEHMLPYIVKHL